MSKRNIRFGIREKLFFLILVVFSALILSTFWQIGEQARRVSSETIGQSLEQSVTVLDTKIESRFNSISEVATSIARDGRILPLVYDSESLTLQDQSLEFQKQLDFDILFFTDEAGNILARSDRPQAIGQNMAGKAGFFDAALAGQSGRGYFLSQGRLMQIVTEPIFDNVATDLVRGTVALAYEFSNEVANEIVALTSSEVGFFSFKRNADRQVSGVEGIYVTDERLGSALSDYFEQTSEPWSPIFNGESAVRNLQSELNEQEYFAATRRIGNAGSEPLGFVMILRSSADLLEPFTRIQNTVLLIGLICLAVAILLAAFVSYRISRPIIELVSVAGNIRDGRYPKRNAAPKIKDEIGVLYGAVVDMGNSLKDKADLENYLAQMSYEITSEDTVNASDLQAELTDDLTNDLTIDLTADVVSVQPEAGSSSRLRSDAEQIPRPRIEPELIASGTFIAGRYEVLKLLGRGAMGHVLLVLDRDLEEKTALKLLPSSLFKQDSTISIKEEIRLARRITHRNILRTFDMGTWGEYTFISMEYVPGYDLDLLLKSRGAQDTYIAVLMVRQICSAMNAAHEEGVIHLDLKPSNMIVNQQGILKIMDFGLAQSMANQSAERSSKAGNTLMGTPRYMAPEQFLNDPLDQRTDIYSIGIILYALLSGSPPFTHTDYMKLAEMHVHNDLPEISGVDGVISGALEQIIRKATEKNPNDRFQTVIEMLEELSEV